MITTKNGGYNMIVPMKHLTIVIRSADRTAALEELRDLGALHLTTAAPEAPAVRAALEQVQQAEQATQIVTAAARARRGDLPPDITPAAATPDAIIALNQERENTTSRLNNLERDIALYTPFGDFDPDSIAALGTKGVAVTLFKAPLHSNEPAADPRSTTPFRKFLSSSGNHAFGVQFGNDPLPDDFEPIAPPPRRLAEIEADATAARERIDRINLTLAASVVHLDTLKKQHDARTDLFDFAAALEGVTNDNTLAWFTGYAPSERLAEILAAARAHGWALLTRDPADDEAVPTLLRPPRLFKSFLRVFEFLGITPSYHESDISSVFYIFFTIFFAMLVGDVGYGLIILGATLWAGRKFKNVAPGVITLFTVFSLATIVWGLLTANIFGINPEILPGPLNHSVAVWLAEQNNIMLVCFSLGAIHMGMGHAWNALCLFPDSRFLAQVGWCGIVGTMFCAACVLIGIFPFPKFMYYVAAISLLLIVLFMLKRHELREKGIDLGLLPLNIISTLGDVISYVRLFAVATASVKLASMFNDMAIGLSLPLIIKIPALVLLLFIGHAMNLAMGALSILVHAVRLNTLEFSNHKGISWAGFTYNPFRRRVPAGDPAGHIAN
ncbi:MAG: hypothetical protein GX230_04380 [Lentisphaerae bacterium]|nr:hypothetical protein [Lentisphaerota bacterium]